MTSKTSFKHADWFPTDACTQGGHVGRAGFLPLEPYQTYPRINQELTISNLVKTVQNTAKLQAFSSDVADTQLAVYTSLDDTSVTRYRAQHMNETMWYSASILPWDDLVRDLCKKFGQKVHVVCGVDPEVVGGKYKEGGFEAEPRLMQASNYLCTLDTNRVENGQTYISRFKAQLTTTSITVAMSMYITSDPSLPIDLTVRAVPPISELRDVALTQITEMSTAVTATGQAKVVVLFPMGLHRYGAQKVASAYRHALLVAKRTRKFSAVVFSVRKASDQKMFHRILGSKQFDTFDGKSRAIPRYNIRLDNTDEAIAFKPWMDQPTQTTIQRLMQMPVVSQPDSFVLSHAQTQP